MPDPRSEPKAVFLADRLKESNAAWARLDWWINGLMEALPASPRNPTIQLSNLLFAATVSGAGRLVRGLLRDHPVELGDEGHAGL